MWPALVHVRHVHALIYVKTPEGRRMCVCVNRAEFTKIDRLLRSAINVDSLIHIHKKKKNKTYSIRIHSFCLVLVIDLATTIFLKAPALFFFSLSTHHTSIYYTIMLSRYRIVSKTRFFCNFFISSKYSIKYYSSTHFLFERISYS